MESYRREVEKMKQLQEGKEEEQEVGRDASIDRSRKKEEEEKTIAHRHFPVLSLSLSVLSAP